VYIVKLFVLVKSFFESLLYTICLSVVMSIDSQDTSGYEEVWFWGRGEGGEERFLQTSIILERKCFLFGENGRGWFRRVLLFNRYIRV